MKRHIPDLSCTTVDHIQLNGFVGGSFDESFNEAAILACSTNSKVIFRRGDGESYVVDPAEIRRIILDNKRTR